MPKSNRGGKRTVATSTASNPTLNVPVQQVVKGNVVPKGGVAYADFLEMTDDEKADVITDALKADVPFFLDNSSIQKLAYFTGLSDKPDLVDDATLDTMSGTELFRTVGDAYDRTKDIGYSAKEICQQVSEGDFTMYSDSGGSAYGHAIYFADDYYSSSSYGYGKKNPLTMRAKVKSSAKAIRYNALQSKVNNMRGTKLYNACGGDANTIALALGYDIIIDRGGGSYNSGYHMVLNRGCLVMSKTVKNTVVGGSKW